MIILGQKYTYTHKHFHTQKHKHIHLSHTHTQPRISHEEGIFSWLERKKNTLILANNFKNLI